jgi:hypothetical protein
MGEEFPMDLKFERFIFQRKLDSGGEGDIALYNDTMNEKLVAVKFEKVKTD